MQRQFGEGSRLGLILTVSLAAVGMASDAHAHQQSGTSVRIASPSGTGCIMIQSAMSHGGASDRIVTDSRAYVMGLTGTSGAGVCNRDAPSGGKMELAGQLDIYLIKLVQDGTSRDAYTYCRTGTSGAVGKTSMIRVNPTYDNAPCGAGFYTLVACLQRTTTTITFANGSTRTGWFDAAPFDCVHSPNWHAVGVGSGGPTMLGPIVNL